ncbi:endonuclease/exonuclease/phosphatase family protein [Labilibacter sediminis]|nr:endonuclease/exonuclease/phosphatase family protein [Labilibacter sediminis]
MKLIEIIITLIITSLLLSSSCKKEVIKADEDQIPVFTDENIKACSFNIRYSNDDPDTGDRNWSVRKDWVVDFVNSYDIDIIGLQEEKNDQTADLRTLLSDKYSHFGKASSSKPGYEYNGIFYKRDKFELLESGRFWLSETPDVESIGWDAKYHRQVSWCKFKQIVSGKSIYFFNTHFSHVTGTAKTIDKCEARINSAKLLKNKINSISKGTAIIVTGDFNLWPISDTYRILTETEFSGTKLIDSRTLVASPIGPNYSGHCFGECIEEGKIVDYVFINDKLNVLMHEIVDKQPSANSFLSDHYPVVSELAFK